MKSCRDFLMYPSNKDENHKHSLQDNTHGLLLESMPLKEHHQMPTNSILPENFLSREENS